MSLEEAIAWWDTIDANGSNLPGVRALCLVDRYYLLVKVCKRVDMLHHWSYARCREVERNPDNCIDLWAREHGKSSIITFAGVLQHILNNPEATVCIFSHTGDIARKFLEQIKTELEINEVLKAAFPDILYQNPARQARKWNVEGGIVVKRKGNPKEATLEASGLVDGQPTSKHYSLRVYDDVVTDKSVNTPEQIQKSIAAYSLSQSLGMQGGKEWVIGTRYSYADAYGWMLERESHTARVYPCTEDGTREGKLVLFSPEHWKTIQMKSTDSDIACQYLQDPLSGQQKMFAVADLQAYEVRPSVLSVYIMCDPARSKKRDSDNTAMVVVGLDHAMNKYVLDGFNHRMDLQERWENFAKLYVRWLRMPGVQIVKMGYESFGAQADLDYFREQMKLPGRPKFDIIELAWPREGGGSKVDRVQRLVPDCKEGKILLPYDTDEKKLTSNQRRMLNSGYEHRISRAIKRLDEHKQVYDVTEALRSQFHYFPYGGKKDLIDALSRIYDMEPRPPVYQEPQYLEPEFS